ncbi:hypothetical protein H8N03_23240 [Ramlibacter sp. USB13]|uniref:Uncharacterized protein n=1 Tax=Ramlibacter cellulosilyticus TaxID=2764187 RepID=A0A923MV62_9BURK|nr:hypothetical protein [Ramlibacter cellulosilyticus]MBC5785873.1 hypothetical protein [Ramlibacter cellulosilyticus]
MAREEIDLLPTLAEASAPFLATEHLQPEIDDEASPIEKLKAVDEARDGFPGEHWMVLAMGVAVWQFTRKDRRWYVRALGGFLATTLVARAASGRQGLSKVLRYTPLGRGISACPPCTQERLDARKRASATHH